MQHITEAVMIGLFAPFLAVIPLRLRGWRMVKQGTKHIDTSDLDKGTSDATCRRVYLLDETFADRK